MKKILFALLVVFAGTAKGQLYTIDVFSKTNAKVYPGGKPATVKIDTVTVNKLVYIHDTVKIQMPGTVTYVHDTFPKLQPNEFVFVGNSVTLSGYVFDPKNVLKLATNSVSKVMNMFAANAKQPSLNDRIQKAMKDKKTYAAMKGFEKYLTVGMSIAFVVLVILALLLSSCTVTKYVGVPVTDNSKRIIVRYYPQQDSVVVVDSTK